jgi:hypothetical protein
MRLFKEEQMKKITSILGFAALILAAALSVPAQEAGAERAVVPLTNPAKACLVKAALMRGSITVKGYEGKDVIVEARPREKALLEEGEREPGQKYFVLADRQAKQKEREQEARDKAAGLKLYEVTTSGLTIEEEDNVVDIEVESWKRTVDLNIQVPFGSSLDLENQMGGDIVVEKVSGEIEVENMNGRIKLNDISGTVIANTMNGEILVTFAKVSPGKPMSFSTMNGDVDITLPADVKATLKMKSEQGRIYSDFDISLTKTPQRREEDQRKEGGKYKITFEETVTGTINGGGAEFQFNTFNGDIFIRKAK